MKELVYISSSYFVFIDVLIVHFTALFLVLLYPSGHLPVQDVWGEYFPLESNNHLHLGLPDAPSPLPTWWISRYILITAYLHQPWLTPIMSFSHDRNECVMKTVWGMRPQASDYWSNHECTWDCGAELQFCSDVVDVGGRFSQVASELKLAQAARFLPPKIFLYVFAPSRCISLTFLAILLLHRSKSLALSFFI